MSIIEKTLRQIIAFSEQQRAAQKRRLKAKGKSENTVRVDAYSSVIGTLSSILDKKEDEPEQAEE
ncbi:MAG: hypothetical protein AAF490_26025 [Chloroflexota bacterium]